MSRDVDIFVSDPVVFGALVAEVASILRTDGGLVDNTDGSYEFRVVDVLVMVHATHRLVDDSGIPFERYRLNISLHRLNSPWTYLESHDALVVAMAVYMAARLSERLDCEARVVVALARTEALFRSGQPIDDHGTR